MKYKITLTLIFISIVSCILNAQQRYQNIPFGYSMDKPEGDWKETNNFNKLIEKIGGFEFNESNLIQFMEDNFRVGFLGYKSTRLLSYFGNTDETKLHPTISLHVHLAESSDFEEFTKMVTDLKSYHKYEVPKSIRYEVEPKIIEVSDVKSIYFSVIQDIEINGAQLQLRVIRCKIPLGQYYFSLTFSDYPGKAECKETFDKMISSIIITK